MRPRDRHQRRRPRRAAGRRLAPADRISVVGEWAGDEFFRAADKPGVRRQVRRELALTRTTT
ncbi:hypothetical protein WJ972_15885 [Achromobacter insuavis]